MPFEPINKINRALIHLNARIKRTSGDYRMFVLGFEEDLRTHLNANPWSTLLGNGNTGMMIAMMLGYALVFVGIGIFGEGWRELHQARQQNWLAIGGLYGLVRHPQYTGLFIALFGVGVVHWPTIISVALFPIIVIAYYLLARSEERQAEERFGNEYRQYCKRVPMFIPRLGHWRKLASCRPAAAVLGSLWLVTSHPMLFAATVEYRLTIGEKLVNITGKQRPAIAVNGCIPAPTLTFREGDFARIHVTNAMKVPSSIHWHGLLLPNRMDGVPFVTFPPIRPGETFVYEFRIRQRGTYWYHSHTALQEQRGLYGAFVILPRSGGVEGDRDKAVVLSDWTDEQPREILRGLKRGSEWPALQRGNSQSMFGAARVGHLEDFWKRELLRMPPMDLSDIAYDRFLANGEPEHSVAAKPRESVRLRIVDGSASTFFHLQFAGGPITIVSADGQDVEPVKKDRVLIGVAETYDVIVCPPGPGAYELRATAHDGSAWTSIWIGDGERHPAPDMPHPNLYHAMGSLKPSNIFALTPGGTMAMPDREVDAGKFDKPGMMGGMMRMEEMTGGMKMDHGSMAMRHGATANPHFGKKHQWDFTPFGPDISSRRPLVMDGMGPRPGPPYKDLMARRNTALPAGNPVLEVRLTLDGDMERYVWSLNNKPLFASDSIKIARGENVRFIMINRTMMHHPMHLHGHFFRVINGQGGHSPLKHTVIVPPMETTVIEFDADETGDWFFHCHLLYHMESGMARVVHYEGFSPYPDTAAVRHKLYRDPFYFWGAADLMTNMTQGHLEFSNTRHIFNLEWDAGWEKVPDTEWETTFLYERYFNRFFRLIGGMNVEGTLTTGPLDIDVESDRGVFGLMYKLPLNIDTTAWIDTDGGARVKVAKSIPLTPRLHLAGKVEYDTREDWEGSVHLDYMLSRSASLIGQWHSDYGWGAGLRWRF